MISKDFSFCVKYNNVRGNHKIVVHYFLRALREVYLSNDHGENHL